MPGKLRPSAQESLCALGVSPTLGVDRCCNGLMGGILPQPSRRWKGA